MKRSLNQTITACRESRRPVLSLYLTAGYPAFEATLPLLEIMASNGADLIELGIPFSDPLADGPTIQRSSQRALHNGVTTKKVLAIAAAASRALGPPIILMGYYNPILQFGPEAFVRAAAGAGVKGLIVPDLLPEESTVLRAAAIEAGVSLIYLVSPNSSAERVKQIDELTTSFIYAVSVTGVTGARRNLVEPAAGFLDRIRQQVQHPLLVGFGVSSGSEAARLASHCDGVIVGSALLDRIEKHWPQKNGLEPIAGFVRELRSALGEGDYGH